MADMQSDIFTLQVPRSFNFDVVNLADASSDAFRRFSESLGSDIDRKETVNYIKILTEKFQIAESLASATQARAEPAVVDGEKVACSRRVSC